MRKGYLGLIFMLYINTVNHMKTKRAFKYRFYPTPEQEILLARLFGFVRSVYNTVLAWRT